MPIITEISTTKEADDEDMDNAEDKHQKCFVDHIENASVFCDGDEDEQDDGEEGCSSEMDEDECDRRRMEYIDDMNELSKQFYKIKDQLYSERAVSLDLRLKELEGGTEPEYLKSLAELDKNKEMRIQVAGIVLEFMKTTIQEKFLSEEIAASQHMESEKELLHDQIRHDLEERIRRLEEDRHNIDISSDLFESRTRRSAKKRDHANTDRRKKPVVVSGPYIVYCLPDEDVIDDWTTIMRAAKLNCHSHCEHHNTKLGHHRRRVEL